MTKLERLNMHLATYNIMAWDNVTVHRAGNKFYFWIKGRVTLNMRYAEAYDLIQYWIYDSLGG